ncbi:Ubiquitin-conjugating enzyme E2 6, partial [Cladochytrium tenue]
ETWCPGWSVSSVLVGLLSFMLEDTVTNGSVTSTADEKLALARASYAYNRSQSKFREVFPEVAAQPPPPPTTAAVAATTPAPVTAAPATAAAAVAAPAPAPAAPVGPAGAFPILLPKKKRALGKA